MFNLNLEGARWGIDGVDKSSLNFAKPVDDMNIGEVNQALDAYDHILSACYEETELDLTTRLYSRVENPRAEKAEEARAISLGINAPDSLYHALLVRFNTLAATDDERRAVDLRTRKTLWDALCANQAFITARKAVAAVAKQQKVAGLSLNSINSYMQTEPDQERRRTVFAETCHLDDLETALHTQIQTITHVAQDVSQHRFQTVPDLVHHYFEAPAPTSVLDMMRRFVDGTKDIYNALFRELVATDGPIHRWDIGYLKITKDPFSRLCVPTDHDILLDVTLDFFSSLGYEPAFKALFDPQKPGVILDIEAREGKGGGAGMSELGPYSHGKNIFYIDPASYTGNPRRRWTVTLHEAGHVAHTWGNRQRVSSEGAAFFNESSITTETFSYLHESLARRPETLRKYRQVLGDADFSHLRKWELFLSLDRMYGSINIAATEIGIHTKGVEHARDIAIEISELVRADSVMADEFERSSRYARFEHLFKGPGKYFAYFMSDLNRLTIEAALKEKLGAVCSPKTASFLLENFMCGNRRPMSKRIEDCTGVNNPLVFVLDYVRKEYANV